MESLLAATLMPAEHWMSTRQLLQHLRAIPSAPRGVVHPRNWATAAKSVRDYVLQAPAWSARLGSFLNKYPKPFEKVTFRSLDGTKLSAWLGKQETKPVAGSRGRTQELREGILIVPGMFSSKDNILQRARVIKIFQEWGYHVFAMDLRGFGESKRILNTAGWREAEDVIAAIREFRKRASIGVLHIYSESLGASAALIAAARVARQGEKLIDGRLLAVSPYADLAFVAKHLSGQPVKTGEFYMVQWFFLRLLHLGGSRYKDFVEYTVAAAESEGISLAELYELSSAKNFVKEINVPTLILHSYDDPVVPPADADEMEKALAQLEEPALWRLPWGNHCLYELLDPDWFWTVLRVYFDFACPLPNANAVGKAIPYHEA
jgi:pimeloyl-ACP methyl ester carboxylesterase